MWERFTLCNGAISSPRKTVLRRFTFSHDKSLNVQGCFRNTKEQKRAITPSRNKHCFKKQLNFWSSDVLNSKMGIILKKKKMWTKRSSQWRRWYNSISSVQWTCLGMSKRRRYLLDGLTWCFLPNKVLRDSNQSSYILFCRTELAKL